MGDKTKLNVAKITQASQKPKQEMMNHSKGI